MDFLIGVHDERAIPGNGFIDWHSLKKQELAHFHSIAQLDVGVGLEGQGGFGGH